MVFDANLYIAEDTEQSSLALLHYFVPNNMINTIQKITKRNFQKAFIIANVCSSFINCLSNLHKISSIPKNSILSELVTEDLEISPSENQLYIT